MSCSCHVVVLYLSYTCPILVLEADEREVRTAAGSKPQLVEERDLAVRCKRGAWLAKHGRGHVATGNIQEGLEAVGKQAAQGRRQLAQQHGSELLVGAFSWMQKQRAIGEIPDMLTCGSAGLKSHII